MIINTFIDSSIRFWTWKRTMSIGSWMKGSQNRKSCPWWRQMRWNTDTWSFWQAWFNMLLGLPSFWFVLFLPAVSFSISIGRTDRRSDRRTDRRTDRPSHRDAFLTDASENWESLCRLLIKRFLVKISSNLPPLFWHSTQPRPHNSANALFGLGLRKYYVWAITVSNFSPVNAFLLSILVTFPVCLILRGVLCLFFIIFTGSMCQLHVISLSIQNIIFS